MNTVQKVLIGIGALILIVGLFLCGIVVGWVAKPAMPNAVLTTPVVPTPTPTAPAAPAMPTTNQVTPAAPTVQTNMECRAVQDYQLKDLTEVATSENGWIHVEFWTGADAPEFETLLPGGRYIITFQFSGGHVWEYPTTCSQEQVMSQISAHITRRLAQKAKNGGYVPWEQTGYFQKVK